MLVSTSLRDVLRNPTNPIASNLGAKIVRKQHDH